MMFDKTKIFLQRLKASFLGLNPIQYATLIALTFISLVLLSNLREGHDAAPRYVAFVGTIGMIILNVFVYKYPNNVHVEYITVAMFMGAYYAAGVSGAGAGTTYHVFLSGVPVLLFFYFGVKLATFVSFISMALSFVMPVPHFYPYADAQTGPGPDFGNIFRMRANICAFSCVGCVWIADYYRKRLYRDREIALDTRARFVASVSHELRTPLQAIGACADVLKERLKQSRDTVNHEIVAEMSDSVNVLLTLVSNVLDYTRSDDGKKMMIDVANFVLDNVCQSCVRMLSRAAEDADIELALEISPDLQGMVISGDSYRIQQVLVNFLANAVKFTSRSSRRAIVLKVFRAETALYGSESESDGHLDGNDANVAGVVNSGTSQPKSQDQSQGQSQSDSHFQICSDDIATVGCVTDFHIRFEVHDTGIGIAPEKQQLLFEPFSQLDSHRGGTGLGLVVSREIATALHGEVGMYSAGVGQGSVFWLQVPLCRVADSIDTMANVKDKLSISMLGVQAAGVNLSRSSSEEMSVRYPDSPEIDRIGIGFPIHRTKHGKGKNLEQSQGQNVAESGGGGDDIDNTDDTDGSETDYNDDYENPARVLLVDDSRHVKFAVITMAKHFGIDITYAENGSVALDMLNSEYENGNTVPPFDLLLVDLQMPVMDGLEFIRAFRKRERDLNLTGSERRLVYALTATSEPAVKNACLRDGFDDFLCKPITLDRMEIVFENAGIL